MRLIALAITVFLLTIATTARDQTSGQKQPDALTIASLTGKDTFDAYCAPCHGQKGTGDGPVGPILRTPPSDLTRLSVARGSFPREDVVAFVTGNGRSIVAHGTSDMPIWGLIFKGLDPSDTRVKLRLKNVVDYVESLQRH